MLGGGHFAHHGLPVLLDYILWAGDAGGAAEHGAVVNFECGSVEDLRRSQTGKLRGIDKGVQFVQGALYMGMVEEVLFGTVLGHCCVSSPMMTTSKIPCEQGVLNVVRLSLHSCLLQLPAHSGSCSHARSINST